MWMWGLITLNNKRRKKKRKRKWNGLNYIYLCVYGVGKKKLISMPIIISLPIMIKYISPHGIVHSIAHAQKKIVEERNPYIPCCWLMANGYSEWVGGLCVCLRERGLRKWKKKKFPFLTWYILLLLLSCPSAASTFIRFA